MSVTQIRKHKSHISPSCSLDGASVAAIRQLFDTWSAERSGSSDVGGETSYAEALPFFRELYAARRARDTIFPDGMFADPAWDILIDLYIATAEGRRISVSSACIAASVPATTALRHVWRLEDMQFLERQNDARDGRRVFLALTPAALIALQQWFHVVRSRVPACTLLD